MSAIPITLPRTVIFLAGVDDMEFERMFLLPGESINTAVYACAENTDRTGCGARFGCWELVEIGLECREKQYGNPG